MRTLVHDLRQTFRAMAKQPLFAAVAVLTLALGIGANTAIFSVVHAVLLEPVPYPAKEPKRVLFLTETTHRAEEMSIAYPNFKDWQSRNQSFAILAGVREASFNLTGLDEAIRLGVTQVSHDYFEILGVVPAVGRFFTPEEDRAGAERVLVLNQALWRTRFGGDPGVLGRVVELDGTPYTVIGVLPEDFELDAEERAYAALEPWADNEYARDRGNHQGLFAVARLRDGVSLEEARTELETIVRQLESQYPATNSGVGVVVKRLLDRRVEDYERTLWTLLGAVSLVLLIACANVANLLLARAVSRKRAVAIQAALGASRWRLVRQGLTEGVALSVLGGALGTVLAFWGLALLSGLLPADVPGIDRLGIDSGVLFYTLGVSLLTGVLFGSVPAWVLSRARPADSMKEGSRDTGGAGVSGRGLLVAEMTLATLLLIGAGLLIRTVYELTRVDPGFRTDRLLTMRVGVPSSRYDGEVRNTFLRQLDERVEALPGVESSTVGLVLPMMGTSWSSVFIVGDQPVPPRGELPASLFSPVEPGYFQTLGIPLLRGRLFEESDGTDAPRVVVVNETLANRFWPGEDPIGKRLKQGWPESEGPFNPWREIVGVVGDVKQFGLSERTSMQTYIPLAQNGVWSVHLAVRSATDPMSLLEPVKHAISELDASLPVYDVETMDDAIRDSIAPRRFSMVLLGIFASLALVLAAVGLYGVISYSVARRVREIGLRMSVGASRSDVFRLVVRQGMIWAALGAGLGLILSVAASRLLSSFLFGVSARDPLTYAAVPVLLLAVAFASSALPALSASRIDPMRALRYE